MTVPFDRASVTSAASFPTKLLRFYAGSNATELRPIHAQICISNLCQLHCSFCSCKKEKPGNMPLEMFRYILLTLKHAGVRAVTLSGGGEPLLNPAFIEMVDLAKRGLFLDVSLVTNGVALRQIPSSTLELLSWVRVSMDESRKEFPAYLHEPPIATPIKPGLSYVWARGFEKRPILHRCVTMAQNGMVHHLRVVSDILDPRAGDELEAAYGNIYFGDNVIVQPRHHPEGGTRKCWLPFIKPMFSVTGEVYTCCGAQYALIDPEQQRILPDALRIGNNVDEYLNWIRNGKPFNGKICDKCYYGAYNRVLDALHAGAKGHPTIEYPNFI